MEAERKGKGEKRAIDQSKVDDEILGCLICLKPGHLWVACPYEYKYPAGAKVGRDVEIICLCCGDENAHPGKPGVNWPARCELKDAVNRPTYEEELKALGMTVPPEDDGTGQRKRIKEHEQGGEVFELTEEDVFI